MCGKSYPERAQSCSVTRNVLDRWLWRSPDPAGPTSVLNDSVRKLSLKPCDSDPDPEASWMRETETSPVFCDTAVKIYLSDWQPSSTWSLKLTLMQYFSDVSVLRWLLNLRSQLQSFCRLSCRETRFAPHLSQNKITFENNANNRATLTRHVKMVRTDLFWSFF